MTREKAHVQARITYSVYHYATVYVDNGIDDPREVGRVQAEYVWTLRRKIRAVAKAATGLNRVEVEYL